MIPWEKLDTTTVPGSTSILTLHRRGSEFAIRVDGRELMNNLAYGSEDALAEHTCPHIAGHKDVRVLVGGLGMGYTLAAALKLLGPDATVVVAELVPAVVEWNRTYLADFAGRPLDDSRVKVHVGDVAEAMQNNPGTFDAVMLDVDNGPHGLTREANDKLYTARGLKRAKRSLKPDGILAVWSAGPEQFFVKRLKQAAFSVREIKARGRGAKGGAHYTIWLARPMQ